MTLPTSFNSAERIIAMAYQDSGLLQEGDWPNSDQLASGLIRLCDMIALWCSQGLKLFLWQDISITLTAGQATYSVYPLGNVAITKPMKTVQAYYLDAQGNKTDLQQLSWDEYLRLSRPVDQGTMNSYFPDKQADRINITFWPTPSANAALGVAHVLFRTASPAPSQLNANVQFPPEWYMALRWGLADDLCTGQPQAIVDRCSSRAVAFRHALEDWDVEDAPTYFALDQAYLAPSRFR